MIRPVAGALMLAVAILPSVECFTSAQMTPEHHACCAAMKGECEMAVIAACCPTDPTESLGLITTKKTLDFNAVSVLVAILTVPASPMSLDSHIVAPRDLFSSSPPGVPKYLFVSSFRI